MKKTLTIILLIVILTLTFTSCKGDDAKVNQNSAGQSQEQESSFQAESKDSTETLSELTLNPLTGEHNLPVEAAGKRPIAVVVGNSKGALPQYGIDAADICYETLVEGGITRILALYSDPASLPRVGPVRSSREYFVDLALWHDAILAHAGMNYLAKDKVQIHSVDHLNEITMAFAYYRDTALNKPREHTCFTDAEHITKGIKNNSCRTEVKEVSPAFDFTDGGAVHVPDELSAERISVTFSGTNTTVFNFDRSKGKYLKSQFGEPQMDAATNTQVSVDNVFVLFTRITKTGDPAGLVALQLSGEGYYAFQGGARKIKWSKGENPADPLKLTLPDGEKLEVNPGQSWICLAPTSQQSKLILE